MYIQPYEEYFFSKYADFRMTKYVLTIIPPFLFVLGSMGNCMGILVLRKKLKVIAAYNYLLMLAVVDQSVLIFGLLNEWLKEMFGIRPETWNIFSCKAIMILQFSCTYASAWFIVAMTTERFIAVIQPLKAYLGSQRKTKIIILIIFIVDVLVINSHWMWTLELIPRNITIGNASAGVFYAYNDCGLKPNLNIDMQVWWLDTLVYFVVPSVIIFVMNISMIITLKRARVLRNQMTSGSRRSLRKNSPTVNAGCEQEENDKVIKTQEEDRNGGYLQVATTSGSPASTSRSGGSGKGVRQRTYVTVMLLMVSMFFLVCCLPIAGLKLAMIMGGINMDTNDHSKVARYQLLDAIFKMIMYCNNVFNFYLYCVSGQKFRQELCSLKLCVIMFKSQKICQDAKNMKGSRKNASSNEQIPLNKIITRN